MGSAQIGFGPTWMLCKPDSMNDRRQWLSSGGILFTAAQGI
jgi:hypothetical protein